MPNHTFAIEGDLTKIHCDGWLLPTDAEGNVVASWLESAPSLRHAVEPAPEYGCRLLASATEQRSPRVRRLIRDPSVWPVNTADDDGVGFEFFRQSAAEFVAVAARETETTSRCRPLLAMPLIGSGAGGGDRYEARLLTTVIDAVIDALDQSAVDADVVLVLRGRHRLAAANAHRLRRQDASAARWDDLGEEGLRIADSLARRLRDGQLTFFVGAGASAAAGLPDWEGLIEALVARAQLEPSVAAGLGDLDVLDQATLLKRALAKQELSLASALREVLPSRSPSLTHWLLANLDVREAATTNYDDLLEVAAEGVGRPFRRVRYEEIRPGDRWLLKLHGTLDPTPADIVLTRGDYLRFGERSAALAGLVHALLLTRHMLFVGFSLRDPNFHRIAHEVRAALGDAEQRPWASTFGTAVLPSEVATLQAVWEHDIRLVGTLGANEKPGPAAFRRSDLFLDALLTRAGDPAAYLLSEKYASAVLDEDLPVREALLKLKGALASAPAGAARSEVERLLKALGADS